MPISAPMPCWKTRTISPYAAPTDNKFMMIAFKGITTDRNATIKSGKLNPRTTTKTMGVYVLTRSKKSALDAVNPVTNTSASTPEKASGI